MNKKIVAGVALAFLSLAGGLYFWPAGVTTPVPQPPPAAVAAVPETPPTAAAPVAAAAAIRYPLAAIPAPASVPDLGRSDAPFLKSLGEWLGHRALALLFGDDIIRRVVKTVDNLPRKQLPPDALPFKPVPGVFATAGRGDALIVGQRNAARYAPYVGLVRRLDAGKLAGTYVAFYPLFQSAYEELAPTNGYFNDRLVETIDDLLAAPDPADPLKLVRLDGLFEFGDADIAARSAGQKILLRMGSANAAVVKAKLRDIRVEVTRGAAPLQGGAGPGTEG